jgi:hypothetical protein
VEKSETSRIVDRLLRSKRIEMGAKASLAHNFFKYNVKGEARSILDFGLVTLATLRLLYGENTIDEELKEIEKNPAHFDDLDDDIKLNEEFILKAINKNENVWDYIDKKFKNNMFFCIKVLRKNYKVWMFLSKSMKNELLKSQDNTFIELSEQRNLKNEIYNDNSIRIDLKNKFMNLIKN